jgi:signal peptidase II
MLGLIGGTVLILDQLTKLWIDATFRLGEQKPIISGFFDLHYIRNTGAAFGFLSGTHSSFRIPFFVGISLIAVGIILYLFKKLEDSLILVPFSLSLVLGGALGNLIDRIRLGEVIDFALIHYRGFRWPAFNVADTAITIGVILLMCQILFARKQDTSSFLSS